ncbi:MAG: protoporphyrinogen oxidase [Ignavibacteriales bacterium]|nr:protoporphyrinogen oxidase [Ignavibacteriales bacterium]
MKNIVILGAGISGLATAHWLHRQNIDFTILEAGNEPGGSIKTVKENGYTIDFGPNSGLETSPFIRELVSQVGLDDEMVYANETSNKRYILKNDELMPLPMSAGSFFKSALFSVPGKLRLLKEPFVGRSLDGYNQSIAEFVERRLGREFLDYAIDPFVSGVFAGDAEKLSVKSAFPKLYRLEEVYGGLVKGMVKGAKERKEAKKRNEESKQSAKMFSFKSGMGILPKTIVEQFPDRIIYGCRVTNVKKENGKFSITGAIWSSVIFENRAPSNQAGFTIFIGGARNSDIFRRFGNDLEQKVLGEFQRIMKIDVDPVFTSSRMWEKAIPQYNLGYNLHEDYFTKIELENPGLVLSGNYRGGISIGDCFKNSKPAAERILNLLW